MSQKRNSACAGCGMPVAAPAYHPWGACELFRAHRDSRTVEANIRAIVAYGHTAAQAGVSVDEAMRSINWRRVTPTKAKKRTQPARSK